LTRRLAAILVADVVGYSRLMEADEAGTLSTLKILWSELIDPIVTDHHGRVVKLMGDGALVEFASVIDATECAVKVQLELGARNIEIPPDQQIAFRIGISLGDVIVEGEDIYGEGVNIAARLEALAEPGGVYISEIVRQSIGSRLDLDFEDLGEHQVKNIAKAVHVFRIRLSGEAVPFKLTGSEMPSHLAIPHKPSIAVMPFISMSGEADHEFFADGITEEIITALSKIRWFFVIARNTVFAYKGRPFDVKQVARELGVRYVVEGSTRKIGSRVRVIAQLIDATTGNHVWAERYDGDLSDIFAIQDEMTQTIVGAIEPELGSVERERARRKAPDNLDAWSCYQRGLWHLFRFTKADIDAAEQLFQRSATLDPGFSGAFMGLASVGYWNVLFAHTDSPDEVLANAFTAARTAVSLDDKDAMAHWALGRVYTQMGESEAAIAELEAAISINPSFAHGHYNLGWALVLAGRAEEALPHYDRALRLNPHDPCMWIYLTGRAIALVLLHRHAEAANSARRAVRQPSANFYAPLALASALGHLGQPEEARLALDQVYRLRPDFSKSLIHRCWRFRNDTDRGLFLDGLVKAGLPTDDGNRSN
jgi:TolB-like protein/class 3 adenylate cyclase/tetratricopeptide (TPR) repeat protein